MEKNKTILVLENLDSFMEIMSVALKNQGYRIIPAASVKEARLMIKDKTVDLAILDMKLPEETGLEYSKELKKTHPGLPVIFCTGYMDQASMSEIDSTQVVDLLIKPFPLPELKKRVQEILGI
ncbi:MAG: response regulator [Elusimicrobiota bacterium]